MTEIGAGVLQHQAPGDQRRLHGEAEKAEEGFQQHDDWDRQRDRDDDVAHHIRQDVLEDDAPVGGADGDRRPHIVDAGQRQRLAAHLAATAAPSRAPTSRR